jgi:hypothetical protein
MIHEIEDIRDFRLKDEQEKQILLVDLFINCIHFCALFVYSCFSMYLPSFVIIVLY